MAAPNIGSTASSVFLRSASGPVGTATGSSATLLVTNGTASSAVLRITRLDVCNIDGEGTAAISVVRLEGSNSTTIISTVAVPADATLRIYDDYGSCAVPEGNEIRLIASSAGDLTYDAEYQEFT
jgi:hypothetical protein